MAQLNDTHPSIAVAELMRLLVDEHLMDWDTAWHVTQETFAYTNHTLLAEALEQWPLPLFGALLPRHLEIVFEINRRFLDEVRVRYPNDDDARRARVADRRAGQKSVRMAHLASVGSHAINGVAALHTELLKHGVLSDFYDLYPERFHNITNGVTPRRWMARCNPDLTRLITRSHRRQVDSRHGTGAAAPRAVRRGPRVPRRVARGSARQQGGAGAP